MNDLDDLLAEAEEWASSYISWGDNGLVDRLIVALESMRAERDAALARAYEVAAEAWDEGHDAGWNSRHDDAICGWMPSGVHESDAVNPYRKVVQS